MTDAQLIEEDDVLSPRERAEGLFRVGLEAVDPSRLLVRALGRLPSAIHGALDQRRGRLFAFAAGKAALGMARALEDAIGEPREAPGGGAQQPPPPIYGVAICKRGAVDQAPRRLRVVEAGHPIPDEAGAAAADDVVRMLSSLGPEDLAFGLLSGGGSAMLAAPARGLTLTDLQVTTRLLLDSGAPIDEVNAVRKHLSRTAGGRLAAASRAAALLTFAISDVPGDHVDVIASGPTVPDPTTYADALAVIDARGLAARVPPVVRAHLERGARGEQDETPKPGDPCFARARTTVIGGNGDAVLAIVARVREMGMQALALKDALRGEARDAGRALGARLLDAQRRGARGLVLVAGGETTVRVRGGGKGGRNQEVACGAALALDGASDVTLLAAGTDGEDGPTDAAGAFVHGDTARQARGAGMDLVAALAKNDVYPVLDRLGALVRTGPTGTNVMDLAIGMID